MNDKLEAIEEKVGRNFDSPPLHLWHPQLSGDIDIRIDREGSWFHEGAIISRDSIVRLFASILRREEDGHYYLVTPGEKWRIQVDVLPLVVTDIEWSSVAELPPQLSATLNTGKTVTVDATHPLYLEPKMDNIPAIRLPHGLAALFSRGAWYRLVEMSEQIDGTTSVVSAGEVFPLEAN
jgi:hypothetical protein